MELNRRIGSDLDRISRAVSRIEGVVLCILFGSRVRGDSDAYSDYDLLVVFEDKDKMWRNFQKLYENTSSTNLFIQAMPVSMDELSRMNEDFLKDVFEKGIVLYQRYPFTSPGLTVKYKPMAIIEYKLNNLKQEDKLRLEYRLFGRAGKGFLNNIGGYRLGRGVVVIPRENVKTVSDTLKKFGAKIKTHHCFMEL